MESIFSAWLIWFLCGVGLAFLELLMPGFVVLFMGIGCLVVSGLLLLWPLTLTQQFLVFIAATIASIVFLRKWLMRIFKGRSMTRSEPDFDDFPEGALVKVARPVSSRPGGRIEFRGSLWDAVADEEIGVGETAKIVRYAGGSRQTYFVQKP